MSYFGNDIHVDDITVFTEVEIDGPLVDDGSGGGCSTGILNPIYLLLLAPLGLVPLGAQERLGGIPQDKQCSRHHVIKHDADIQVAGTFSVKEANQGIPFVLAAGSSCFVPSPRFIERRALP